MVEALGNPLRQHAVSLLLFVTKNLQIPRHFNACFLDIPCEGCMITSSKNMIEEKIKHSWNSTAQHLSCTLT